MSFKFRSLPTFVATLFLVALALVGLSMAQNIVTGGISGTVTDPSGAVVSNAKVSLKSNSEGNTQTTVTTSTGLYNFPLLKPGTYTVSIAQSGFRSVSETVEVPLGQIATANMKLAVGNTSETIEVSGTAPLLQTEDANISTTYNQSQITSLPAPGGDITSYAQTAPGVLMNTGGAYGNFSAFGLPATSNLFTLNGNDENDPFLNLNNSGSSNLLLGQNEVQEVAVVSNGYTAQYGRQAGVQVDYSTKSGSNAFHGNAAFWFNSSGFNANDWYQKQSEVSSPGETNHQPFAVNHMWAGSIGGPIVKNKLFFYVDQEGLYYALPSVQTVNLPTAQFSNAILANIANVSPAQLPYYTQEMNLYKGSPIYAQALLNPYSAASGGGCGFGGSGSALIGTTLFGVGGLPCTGSGTASGVNHNKEWLLTERIDYNISNNDKLFGRFKVDHGDQPTSTDLVDPKIFSTSSNQPEYEGQINETHIFSPTMVNNFIVSGLWYTAIFLPDSGQAAVLAANGYSTIQFNSGSLSSLGGTNSADDNFPQGRNSAMGQVTDDLSITRGAHTFKMGMNFRRDILIDYDAQSNTGGFVQFGSLLDFANGSLIGANGDSLTQVYTTNGDVRIGFYSLGLYFQDEYRVTPNLKLTLALRGDRNSNPICSQNCYSRLDTPFTGLTHDVLTPYNAVIDAGTHSAFPNVEKVALQPRFGFTWSPLGHTNTVLRGGVGVFSDLYQGVLMDELIGNSPLTNTFAVKPSANAAGVGAPLAPGAAGSVAQLGANSNSSFLNAFASGGTLASISASNPFFTPPGFTSIANQINNPKYLEWNFEIQQAIGSKMSLNVDYVGTHGYNNLIQNANLNAANMTLPFTGTFTPFGQLPQGTVTASGIPLSGTDPRFATVRELQSVGVSNYDGMVVTFSRKFTHGFQGSVNYTWSHALDDLTTTNPGTPFNVFASTVYQFNPNCLSCSNYSNSDSDARHNLTANYVWELPFKSQNKFLNETIGGWTVAGTFFAHSGLPYTPQALETGLDFEEGTFSIGGLVPDQTIGNVPVNCQSSHPGTISTPTPCIQASQFAPSNFVGGVSQPGFGNVPRNSFRGLGYFDTDLNVNKSFAITERVKFELGGSFFNILNHPNFGLPNQYGFQPQFGQMCSSGPFGCNALAVQPTTPYGAFQGAGVEGRLVQVHGKITF
jgi:Carboxypeptidase regulatory-like domain